PQRNFVAVLLDDSRSMQIADDPQTERSRADFVRDAVAGPEAAMLKALRAKFQVRLFRFGSATERVDDPTRLKYDQGETRLGGALEAARRELESVPISGLVVLSDGADNSRTPIADQLLSLRAKPLPVFTVGIGAEHCDK